MRTLSTGVINGFDLYFLLSWARATLLPSVSLRVHAALPMSVCRVRTILLGMRPCHAISRPLFQPTHPCPLPGMVSKESQTND